MTAFTDRLMPATTRTQRLNRRGVIALLLAILVVAGAAGLISLRTGNGAADEVGLDSDGIVSALTTLKTQDGLLASPPVLGSPSLDTTGWTAAVLDRLKIARPEPSVARLNGLGDAPDAPSNRVWRAFFAALVLKQGGPGDAKRLGLADWVTTTGWVEDKPEDAPADVPATVLSTWAAAVTFRSTDQPLDQRTIQAARDALARCEGNTFVQVHLVEIILGAMPDDEEAVRQLSRCPFTQAALDSGNGVQNEVALLSAFAEAKRAALVGDTRPERLTQLTRALVPQNFMLYDPWWTYYALEGFLAAGGDPAAYQNIGKGLRAALDPDGLARRVGTPTVNVQGMFYAVQTAQALGRDPSAFLDAKSVLRYGEESHLQSWTDGDVAIWGDLMYLLGQPLSEPLSESVRNAAQRCSNQTVTPPLARQIARCRAALAHFGGDLPSLKFADLKWSSQPAEILVDVTNSTDAVPDVEAVRKAVEQISASPHGTATSILAALPKVASVSGSELKQEVQREIFIEISRRHGEGALSGLYKVQADGSFPDYASTSAVARMIADQR